MPATTVTPAALVAEVRAGIAALADPAKAGPMQAYMKSAMPYHGVTSQPLLRLCRELFTRERLAGEDEWRDAVLDLWDGATFREERYAATWLAGHRHYREHQQPHTLGLYRHLVVTGAWWDHVDAVATHLVRGLLERHPEPVTPELRGWAVEDDLWLRRSRDHLPGRSWPGRRPRPADRRDRRQPRRLEPHHAGGVGARPGVLRAQGDRVGAARPRPHRPGMGAGVRGRAR